MNKLAKVTGYRIGSKIGLYGTVSRIVYRYEFKLFEIRYTVRSISGFGFTYFKYNSFFVKDKRIIK